MPPKPLARLRLVGLSLLIVCAAAYVAITAFVFLGQRQMLYFPAPAVARPAAGSGIEAVVITTADHERLNAWYAPARPGRPTVLYFGGNAEAVGGDIARFTDLQRDGEGMLAIAYRGYGGSTGKPTEAGLTEDARAAYAWLALRTPASSIIIHGHSLGAAVAVRLAADHPARARALVLESPFTSAVDLGEDRLPGLPVRWLMLDRYPSRDLIGQVRAPVLVVHGDADAVIPFRMGQALFALAKGPKRFVRIRGGGHNDLWSLGLHGHIEAFLAATASTALPQGGERP